jgi:hypothetical protein
MKQDKDFFLSLYKSVTIFRTILKHLDSPLLLPSLWQRSHSQTYQSIPNPHYHCQSPVRALTF